MPLEGTYEPSPWEPIAAQVELYEQTDGREGGELQGKPVVVLWTRGRHSGAIRKTPLMRVHDGGRYAVVASLGGAPQHPVWYLNLVADPNASLQDGAVLRDYLAREAIGEEKRAWWERATAVWPDYDTYQASTDREIPLVILEPVEATPEP
jgi:deazaflavin-dependent oxidoreductase (nitroreductase family)